MQTSYRSIKGTFDILPESWTSSGVVTPGSAAWRHLEQTVRDTALLFGFGEIRTPILEPTELVARGVGELTDIVSKEMFSFEKGKTKYVLRPEFTAPVMRAYLQHRLDQQGGAQRLYYIGPCFRAERPARGRFRQFHQFGAEVIGADDPQADAEVISLMTSVYRAYGIETSLKINSLGSPECRAGYRKVLREFLEPLRPDLSELSQQRLETNPLRILDTKIEHEKALLEDAPLMRDSLSQESADLFDAVLELLDSLKIEYQIEPRLVRGLDYYTHTTFELIGAGLGEHVALAGGGRYDLLARDLGNKNPVPGVGFAAGIERLLTELTERGYTMAEDPAPHVFLAGLGDNAHKWCFVQADTLRRAGITASFDLKGRSLKAQMREANRLGAKWVILVGENEMENQQATVKKMEDGSQQPVPFDHLVAYIRSETGW